MYVRGELWVREEGRGEGLLPGEKISRWLVKISGKYIQSMFC